MEFVFNAVVWITLINPLAMERPNELVIVPFDRLGGINSSCFAVVKGEQTLPAQTLDTDFDGRPDAIAFIVSFGPNEQLKAAVKTVSSQTPQLDKVTHAEISVLANSAKSSSCELPIAYGEFISKRELIRDPNNKSSAYRFEGPFIESDKAAYRLYWDNRGAIDAYGKLYNGEALGIGGLGIGSDISRVSPSAAPYAKIIIGSDGPIVSSYRMIYEGIEYQGQKYDITWDMAISAGQRVLTHTVNVTRGGQLQFLAALTNHSDEKNGVSKKDSLNNKDKLCWVGTYGSQVYPDADPNYAVKSTEKMGLGLLWPLEQLKQLKRNDTEFEAVFKPSGRIKYYSLASYNGEKKEPIKGDKDFYTYMDKLASLLANPVIVNVAEPVSSKELVPVIEKTLEFAASQLAKTADFVKDPNVFPDTAGADGKWTTNGPQSWVSGYFPGLLWFMYETSGQESWKQKAVAWTAGMEKEQFNTGYHDIGLMLYCSYGNGLRLTGDEAYKKVLIQTADSLSKRYSPTVGCTRSWGPNADKRDFMVIIDNMMCIELLFWASENSDRKDFHDIAVNHALKTIENHVRPDGSTYHVVNYDPVSGAVIEKKSAQGYAMESCWSRGQAWALYGFTMVYRETCDGRFLETAKKTADYFINNLPEDYVPYWDFRAPGIPNEKKDSSAAAIAASGLLELCTLVPSDKDKARYFIAAENIIKSLCSPAYLAENTGSKAILLHMVGSRYDSRDTIDRSFIYGDYYFIEALLRYKKMVGCK